MDMPASLGLLFSIPPPYSLLHHIRSCPITLSWTVPPSLSSNSTPNSSPNSFLRLYLLPPLTHHIPKCIHPQKNPSSVPGSPCVWRCRVVCVWLAFYVAIARICVFCCFIFLFFTYLWFCFCFWESFNTKYFWSYLCEGCLVLFGFLLDPTYFKNMKSFWRLGLCDDLVLYLENDFW